MSEPRAFAIDGSKDFECLVEYTENDAMERVCRAAAQGHWNRLMALVFREQEKVPSEAW